MSEAIRDHKSERGGVCTESQGEIKVRVAPQRRTQESTTCPAWLLLKPKHILRNNQNQLSLQTKLLRPKWPHWPASSKGASSIMRSRL